MKTARYIPAALLLICLMPLNAQVFENKDLKISAAGDNMWIVETTDMTTMYIVEGEEKALLIDTGTRCDSLDRVVERVTQKPYDVVITHAHPDHAGNIHFFDAIYLHPADTVLLNPEYKGDVKFVNDGDVFDLGGTKIEVAHMPGHTPGSIVLLDKEKGVCYSGDAFGSGMVWLQVKPILPMSVYAGSCLRMKQIMESENINEIYCGHYPYVKKTYDINYITSMLDLANDLMEGNAPEPEPFNIKVSIGSNDPLIVTRREVSIVYDRDYIK